MNQLPQNPSNSIPSPEVVSRYVQLLMIYISALALTVASTRTANAQEYLDQMDQIFSNFDQSLSAELRDNTHIIRTSIGRCNALAVSSRTLVTFSGCVLEDASDPETQVNITKVDKRRIPGKTQFVFLSSTNPNIAFVTFEEDLFDSHVEITAIVPQNCQKDELFITTSRFESGSSINIAAIEIDTALGKECHGHISADTGLPGSPVFDVQGNMIGVRLDKKVGGEFLSAFQPIPANSANIVRVLEGRDQISPNLDKEDPDLAKAEEVAKRIEKSTAKPDKPTAKSGTLEKKAKALKPKDITEANRKFEECMTTQLPDATFEKRLEHCRQ